MIISPSILQVQLSLCENGAALEHLLKISLLDPSACRFLTQIGTVKAEDQRRELFGPQIQDKQESQGASEPALDVASGKAEQGDPEHSQSSPGAFKGGKVQ